MLIGEFAQQKMFLYTLILQQSLGNELESLGNESSSERSTSKDSKDWSGIGYAETLLQIWEECSARLSYKYVHCSSGMMNSDLPRGSSAILAGYDEVPCWQEQIKW